LKASLNPAALILASIASALDLNQIKKTVQPAGFEITYSPSPI
jgi:hypothetical protein